MATMKKLCIVKLISITRSRGSYGEETKVESYNEVFANRKAITAYEWNNAGIRGYHPQCCIAIFDFEYGGEDIVELDGKRYYVYRTYERDDDKIELYLERREGEEVVNEQSNNSI